jgi:hypothetical protein
MDEMDEEDYGPQPVMVSHDTIPASAPMPRKTTPPPVSSIPSGPSKSTPPKVTGSVTNDRPYSQGSSGGYGGSAGVTSRATATYIPPDVTVGGDYCRDNERNGGGSDRGSIDFDGGGGGGGFGGGGGGCVLGSCLVSMADGTTKPVCELVKGDLVAAIPVRAPSEEPLKAEVSCLISFKLPTGKKNMVRIPHSGLVISPTHPILIPTSTSASTDADETPPNAQWIYPSSLANPLTMPCDRVYNILLSSPNQAETVAVVIGGIQVSTLGKDHNHSFSGDYERVVKELKRVDPEGLERGSVALGGMRRGNDGRVCGFFGTRERTPVMKTPPETGQMVAANA